MRRVMPFARRVGVLIVGLVVCGALLGPLEADGARRVFASHGVTLPVPARWSASDQAVSSARNPIERMTISDLQLAHGRAPSESGGCYASLGRRIRPDHVVAILSEALGPNDFKPERFPARPRRFELPPRRPGEDNSCLGDHATEIAFKQSGRGFYLWIAAGPRAPAAKIRRLLKSLDALGIAARPSPPPLVRSRAHRSFPWVSDPEALGGLAAWVYMLSTDGAVSRDGDQRIGAGYAHRMLIALSPSVHGVVRIEAGARPGSRPPLVRSILAGYDAKIRLHGAVVSEPPLARFLAGTAWTRRLVIRDRSAARRWTMREFAVLLGAPGRYWLTLRGSNWRKTIAFRVA